MDVSEAERANGRDDARAAAVDPDADLVAAIARGDPRAARILVERRLPRILAIARRMLGDAAEADDVAQEVFLRVWKTAADWRPGAAKFETWMARVAINLCYDRLRRRREIPTDAPPEQADGSPSVLVEMDARDTAAAVSAAIAQLPPRQRAAITLVHLEGATNIAAAEMLELSVEALESLLARGRRHLRTALADRAPDLLAPIEHHEA